MKIIRLHKKPKSEDKYMYPFLSYYCKDLKGNVEYKAIPEQTGFKTPDYHVSTIKTLVEIKEIHDAKDRRRSAQWGKIVNNLRKEIRANKKLKQVKGLYSITTPPIFKFPTNKNQLQDASDKILIAIVEKRQSIVIHKVTLKLEKVSDKDSGVYFSTSGLGGSFDPAQTINENIQDKLATANKQLGFHLGKSRSKKKIVLLANHYYLLHWDWDLYKALSYSYKQLLTYKNIDEIWFQNPTKDGSFTHKLLYTKQFLSGYHNQRLKANEENARLFSYWFSALEKLGDEYKEKLFSALREFLERRKPQGWFNQSVSAREEMVRLGGWLVEKKRFDDATWLIEKFINDPSPENPNDYSGSPEFNYHQQILESKDPHIITSVLGHLPWVIQKLSARREEKNKKYTIKAFGYTQKLINHKNYYVKLQAIIPLIEIAKRRQWLAGWGERPREGKYKEFHQAVFNLVGLVEKNPKCTAIAKWLCSVFAYYKDLSNKEASKVLNSLRVTEESAGLFIYYSIYRENHYQNQDIDFESKELEKKLKNLIKSKAKKDQPLRGNLVRHFWKLLNENPSEFDKLSNWISFFIELPYDKRVYGSLLKIIEDWIKEKPDTCISWYETLIKNIAKEISTKEKARNFWLPAETGKILNEVARRESKKLNSVVRKLVKLWELGSFVGSPKKIFESYTIIPNKELRQKTKNQFQKWYKKMKKLNPKLEVVNWK